MSVIRRHRERILAQMASRPDSGGGLTSSAVSAADRAASAFAMRLQHDLRRLKEIQSIERKVEAKREMLPEYAEWVAGLLQAGREAGKGLAEDVLPTIMVWRIDTGDYAGALELAEHVLRHDVPLPARYNRTAPALIAEEIADAALRAIAADKPFDLDILEHVDVLTCDDDMHDQIRAKVHKAIGLAIARDLDADKVGSDFLLKSERALASLRRAQVLDDRIGVKGMVQRIEKAMKPASADTNTAGAAG